MENKQIPRLVTNRLETYSRKIRIGIYDQKIICEECERIFSSWDDYGYRFFNQDLLDEKFIISENKRVAYNFGKCDYKKLKLFFLSILWRASVSNENMFHRVKLGKYEDKIKYLMINNLKDDSSEFSVAISKFDNMNIDGFLDPDRTKFNDVNHYRLYLGKYIGIIKVSNLDDPKVFKDFYIREDKDVICIFRDFNKSKEFKVMKSVVESSLYNI